LSVTARFPPAKSGPWSGMSRCDVGRALLITRLPPSALTSVTTTQNVQRRLASTASASAQKLKPTIPLSSIRTFPPPQAVTPKDSKSPVLFDSDAWATSQSPPPATLTAFAHRVGLGKFSTNPKLIQQACTHESITLPHSKLHPNKPPPLTNTNLAVFGNSLLGLFATEFVHTSYPHLLVRVVKAAISAYVGPTTCADVAREMGAAPLLQWYRAVSWTMTGLRIPFLWFPVEHFAPASRPTP